MKEKQSNGLICAICTQGHKQQWLWLPINAEPCSVCLDCAIKEGYYCNKHNILTLDLDDGKCCVRCVDMAVAEFDKEPRVREKLYSRLKNIFTRDELDSLPQWINLTRLTWDINQTLSKLLPKNRSLQWIIYAKAQRTGLSVIEVEAELKQCRKLSYLIPFLPELTVNDLLSLRPLVEQVVEAKEKKGEWNNLATTSNFYMQFLWNLEVARKKRDIKGKVQKKSIPLEVVVIKTNNQT